MVDELTHEVRPGRVGRVVAIVHAQGRVRDQSDWPGTQLVLGIEQPALRTEGEE